MNYFQKELKGFRYSLLFLITSIIVIGFHLSGLTNFMIAGFSVEPIIVFIISMIATGAALETIDQLFHILHKSNSKKSTKAPKILSKLISLLVPKQDRDNMFGDLDESFPKLQKRVGRRIATITYLKDIISMALPSIAKLVAKLGFAAGLWEIIKRKLL